MFYYQTQEGIFPGSPEAFMELTGATLIEEILFRPSYEKTTLGPANKADHDINLYLRPLYKAYKKNPPKLYLRPGKERGDHALCALESIEKGSVVIEYLGEWAYGSSSPSTYRFGPIDGLHYRNLAAMAEDGFPNLAAYYLYNIGNVPLRVLFVALEEIPAGEILTVNYGMNHSVKVQEHREYRLEAMCSFFSNVSLNAAFDTIKKMKAMEVKTLGWKRALDLENLAVKLQYLYQTPSAIKELIAREIVDPVEFFRFLDNAECRYFILGFPFQPNPRQQELLHQLERIKEIKNVRP